MLSVLADGVVFVCSGHSSSAAEAGLVCLQRLALHERPAASVRLSLAQGLIADSETDTFKPPRHDSTTTAERFGSDLCPGHGLGGGRRWGQGWHPGPKRPGHQQRPAFGAAQHRGSGGGQSFPSFRHRNPALFPRLLTQEHTGTTTGIGTHWDILEGRPFSRFVLTMQRLIVFKALAATTALALR